MKASKAMGNKTWETRLVCDGTLRLYAAIQIHFLDCELSDKTDTSRSGQLLLSAVCRKKQNQKI